MFSDIGAKRRWLKVQMSYVSFQLSILGRAKGFGGLANLSYCWFVITTIEIFFKILLFHLHYPGGRRVLHKVGHLANEAKLSMSDVGAK